ncbi:MAG: hypothetical protein L3J76_02930 [Candidatus Hydrothermae bacterium]|nr:hypothetical protein [Candidatus Hydrothermae bacterium]
MHTVGLAVTAVWQNRPERYDPYRRWLEQAPFRVRLVQHPEDLDGVEALAPAVPVHPGPVCPGCFFLGRSA